MEKIVPVLEFKNVSKHFSQRTVLANLSFTLQRGEIVGLVGASGIGKSTILKMAAGLLPVSNGQIIQHTRQVGYVFQEPRLLPWKTVLENILIPMRAAGVKRNEAIPVAEYYLSKMGLKRVGNDYPGQLSNGMRQRVSLARAFALRPELIFFDEPFSALDIHLKEVLLSLVEECAGERSFAALYVSHAPEEVVRLADRILLLKKGGHLEELSRFPRQISVGDLQQKFLRELR